MQKVSSSMIVAYESTPPLYFDVLLGLHSSLGALLHSSFVPLLKATCYNYVFALIIIECIFAVVNGSIVGHSKHVIVTSYHAPNIYPCLHFVSFFCFYHKNSKYL